ELECRRYRPGRLWREVIAQHDHAIAVCGSVLQAGPLAEPGRPLLAWVSSAFDGDRALRRQRLPAARRLLDRLLDAPLCRRQERQLLARAAVLTISESSARDLAALT